jgi:hypothetical protein
VEDAKVMSNPNIDDEITAFFRICCSAIAGVVKGPWSKLDIQNRNIRCPGRCVFIVKRTPHNPKLTMRFGYGASTSNFMDGVCGG